MWRSDLQVNWKARLSASVDREHLTKHIARTCGAQRYGSLDADWRFGHVVRDQKEDVYRDNSVRSSSTNRKTASTSASRGYAFFVTNIEPIVECVRAIGTAIAQWSALT